jgi:hypothetical protein
MEIYSRNYQQLLKNWAKNLDLFLFHSSFYNWCGSLKKVINFSKFVFQGSEIPGVLLKNLGRRVSLKTSFLPVFYFIFVLLNMVRFPYYLVRLKKYSKIEPLH